MRSPRRLVLAGIRLATVALVAGSLCGSRCVVFIRHCHDGHDPDACDPDGPGYQQSLTVADAEPEAFRLRDYALLLGGGDVRALVRVRGVSLASLGARPGGAPFPDEGVLAQLTARLFVENRSLLGHGEAQRPVFAGTLARDAGIAVVQRASPSGRRVRFTFDELGNLVAIENLDLP